MRYISTFSILFLISFVFNSCSKEEYFKSESGIRKQLQGTWNLIPIPLYDDKVNSYVHRESWTFSDQSISIINGYGERNGPSIYSQSAVTNYTINTTISKAEIKVENVQPAFTSPSRVRVMNCTWQIVQLDDDFLIIANDQDGTTGITELEFQKNK